MAAKSRSYRAILAGETGLSANHLHAFVRPVYVNVDALTLPFGAGPAPDGFDAAAGHGGNTHAVPGVGASGGGGGGAGLVGGGQRRARSEEREGEDRSGDMHGEAPDGVVLRA
ncbi:hypothetical protein P7228_09505 [Altererythrobacter arenosus]|uniref:Uncharacterized protein n=1 Tax=Altererythrobacter arenosus TaxID=3032592 RepID=A0ABY8FW26_9SPHN|nr:hypothetical protein [Altererythrobacter sp. CAU 1644]WFL76234.1 hypothetical protein P7228_09505 [Altererythrobacter sp. CAU 1644]